MYITWCTWYTWLSLYACNFFDDIYIYISIYIIEHIYANRYINSDAQNRGHIAELLIRNYE